MKIRVLVVSAFVAGLVMGVPDELPAQETSVAEDQDMQVAEDTDAATKDENKKKPEKKAHKREKKDDDPVVIINIYVNGQAVVEGGKKPKPKD